MDESTWFSSHELIGSSLLFAFDASNPAATRVKITDFGLAVDRLYQTHAYGAQNEDVPFRWMPPEALKKRRFSEKSDVWAFGVTAWELLRTGSKRASRKTPSFTMVAECR